MMSTAILLASLGEQTTAHPSSGDHGTPAGALFASNLGQHVADSVASQGNQQAVGTFTGLLKAKIETGSKRPDKIAKAATESTPGVKASAVLEQEASKNGVLKSHVSGDVISNSVKIQISETGITGALKNPVSETSRSMLKNSVSTAWITPRPNPTVPDEEKAAESKPVAKQVDSSELKLPSVASSEVAVPVDSPIVAADNSVQSGNTETDPPSVSNAGNLPVVQSRVRVDDLSTKDASIGASVKTQNGGAAQKAAPKTLSSAEASQSKMPQFGIGSVTDGAIPVAAEAVASSVVAFDKRDRNLSGKVAVSLKASEAPVQAVQSVPAGMVLKGSRIVPRANSANTNVANTGKVDAGVTSSSEATGGPDKGAATPASHGDAAGGKSQTDEPIAAIDHPAPVIAPIPSVIAGVIPTISPAGDPTAVKSHATETTVHSTSEMAPLREQTEGIFATPFDDTPRMLTASPTELEVGIPNGVHGWLRVRAEMTDGGSVNASVSAASGSGQEMLHRELHSLTAYLVEEKVAVNAVVVHAPTPAAAAQQGFAGARDLAGQARQGSNDGKQQQQYAGNSASNKVGEGTAYGSSRDAEDDGGLKSVMFATGGSWLSVRA